MRCFVLSLPLLLSDFSRWIWWVGSAAAVWQWLALVARPVAAVWRWSVLAARWVEVEGRWSVLVARPVEAGGRWLTLAARSAGGGARLRVLKLRPAPPTLARPGCFAYPLFAFPTRIYLESCNIRWFVVKLRNDIPVKKTDFFLSFGGH